MPDPLPPNIVAQLKTDPMAALAAALILAGSFPDLVSWAMRAFGGKDCAKTNGELKADGAGGGNGVARSDGARKGARPPEHRAKGHHNPREAAAEHDQALLALMQANPDASVSKLIRMSGRPRNSAVLSLERLEKAGFVEHAARGKWAVVDPNSLEAPAPKPGWLEPLSANRVAKHTAAMRVPDRLTTADA
jgi:hypothetical protein